MTVSSMSVWGKWAGRAWQRKQASDEPVWQKTSSKLLHRFYSSFQTRGRVLSIASNTFTSSDRAPTIRKEKQSFDENYTYYWRILLPVRNYIKDLVNCTMKYRYLIGERKMTNPEQEKHLRSIHPKAHTG